MSKRIALRLSEERLERLDALVGRAGYPSRAAVLTTALDRLLADEQERLCDRAIIDGYTRIPPTHEEDACARASAIASIREEPW